MSLKSAVTLHTSEAAKAGYEAYFDNKDTGDCPYAMGTPEASDWYYQGWRRAQAQYRAEHPIGGLMKSIGSLHIVEYAKGMRNEDLQLEVELPVGNYAIYVPGHRPSSIHQERDFTTTLKEVKGPLSKSQIETIRHAAALLALSGFLEQSDDLFAIVAPPKDQGCAYPPSGWICTREPGHEGPCAAVEVEVKS